MEKEIVVITGAGAGIGRELAELYHKKQHTVIGLDIDPKGKENFPGSFFTVDMTHEEELLKTAQKFKEEIGKPTLWINNAGIASLGPFEKISSDAFRRVMSVNFDGTVNGTRTALSIMKNPIRGTIVNISSLNGTIPAPFMSSYVSSKHAVMGFTRSLQEEFAQTQSPLKILLVSPGFVKTKIMESHPDYNFPDWLNFMVEDPKKTAQEIYSGISKEKAEIRPTFHGKLLLGLYRVSPTLVKKSSRLLLAKNWKELFGLSPIKKS